MMTDSADQDPEDQDASIVRGATTSSNPAQATDIDANRSGHGGSGGPSEPGADAKEEGTVDQSMEEMLGE